MPTNFKPFKIDTTDLTVAEEHTRAFSKAMACHYTAAAPYTLGVVNGDSAASTADYFYWQGQIPGADGCFHIPNLFDGKEVRALASSDTWTEEGAIIGKGLRDSMIGAYVHATVEADCGEDFLPITIAEQATRLEVLVASGLLAPNTVVFSGAKSLHSSWTMYPTDKETWERIQKGLIALVGGDPVCTNPGHKFRRGGTDWCGRSQPLLHSHTRCYQAEELLASIEEVLEEEGIGDVDAAFEALRYSTQLWNKAVKLVETKEFDAAAEMQTQARLIRDLGCIPEDLAPLPNGKPKGLGSKYKATKGGSCPADTLFETHNGTLGTAAQLLKGKEKIAVCCPFHNDKSPSAVIFKGNPHRLYCSSCSTSWEVEPANQGTAITRNLATAMGVQVCESKGSYTETRWEHGPIHANPGIHVLVAHMASGKTVQAAKTTMGKSRLGIGPTIRLCDQLAQKFHAKSYREKAGAITDAAAVVCLPSLPRVSKSTVYDSIVLDEWEGLRRMLYDRSGGIMVRREQGAYGRYQNVPTNRLVRDRLSHHIKQTLAAGGRVIVADANMSVSAIEDLRDLAGGNTSIYAYFAPESPLPLAGRVVNRYESAGSFLMDLAKRAKEGGAGTIACDSRNSVERIDALLKSAGKVDPNDILTIHGNSGGQIAPENWDNYRFVIFNQAAGSGVSYTGTRHGTNYLYATNWGVEIGWDDLLQLTGRNRTAWRHRYYVKPRTFKVESDFDAYRKRALARADGPIHAQDRGAFEGRLKSEFLRAQRGANAEADFYASLSNSGALINDTNTGSKGQRKQAEKLARELGVELKEIRVTQVVDAPLIDDAEAAELRATKDLLGQLTEEDQSKLEKRVTAERWGVVDRDLAADTITTSRRWRQARNAASIDDHLGHDGAVLKMIDARQTEHGLKRSQGHNHYLAAQVLMALLDAAGCGSVIRELSEATDKAITVSAGGATLLNGELVNTQIEKGGTPSRVGWTNKILAENGFVALAKELDERYDLQALLGFKTPMDWVTQAVAFLGYLLRSIGLATKRAKFQGERRTTIDLDKAIEWTCLRVRASAKLQEIPLTIEGVRGLSPQEQEAAMLEDIEEFMVETAAELGLVPIYPAAENGGDVARVLT